MLKRITAVVLVAAFALTFLPARLTRAAWAAPDTAAIRNPYVKVIVSKDNGGFVISTVKGDIIKTSDDNVDLTHRGANMDTSFASLPPT